MDNASFDKLARLAAADTSRRGALRSALASAAAGLGSAALLDARNARAKKKRKKKKCEDCLLCVLSGAPDQFSHSPIPRFFVDDELRVFVNGQIAFEYDGLRNKIGPVAFQARPGDVLRIVAIDPDPNCHALDPLILHCGCREPRKLTDGVPETCPNEAVGTFFDETFTI